MGEWCMASNFFIWLAELHWALPSLVRSNKFIDTVTKRIGGMSLSVHYKGAYINLAATNHFNGLMDVYIFRAFSTST